MSDPTPPEGFESWLDWAVWYYSINDDPEGKCVIRELATLRAKAEFADAVKSEFVPGLEESWVRLSYSLRNYLDRLAAIDKEYQ